MSGAGSTVMPQVTSLSVRGVTFLSVIYNFAARHSADNTASRIQHKPQWLSFF